VGGGDWSLWKDARRKLVRTGAKTESRAYSPTFQETKIVMKRRKWGGTKGLSRVGGQIASTSGIKQKRKVVVTSLRVLYEEGKNFALWGRGGRPKRTNRKNFKREKNNW